MRWIKAAAAPLRQVFSTIRGLDKTLDEIKVNQGILFSELNKNKHSTNLKDYEFKIFSQWGEDGIIQYLISAIEMADKTFIEFGVQDFTESNCRFLSVKDNWDGFVIDGSQENIRALKNSYFYYKYNLVAISSFITRDNINDLLAQSSFGEDIGILSIDLDGNDYFILEAIARYTPRILICEYNAVFGPDRCISVPYDPAFARNDKHYSNLYYGASLRAITHIANKKGYSLVGTNTAGNNCFFVRNDLLNSKVEVVSAVDAFTESQFRESRDVGGNLTFLPRDQRLELIAGLPVINVETGEIESL